MSKTLLLADDSVVIQKLVGLSFANEDVEIVTTDNGDDAVIKAREITPDVILADVVMPGKSGYEVCEAIKQDPTLAHIPVLLLTGTFEAFDEARAASAGADGQITKPFEAQSLVERVSEIMNAASTPAAAIPTTPTEAILDASSNDSADFDFFDPTVSTLSADQSNAQLADARPNQDQTPAIDVSDDSLFGAPGDGVTDELDTQGGSMALGETVAPGSASPAPREALQLDSLDDRDHLDADQTIVVLPEQVTPLPPSSGDPLATFESDLDAAQETILAAPTPVDLDTALDAVPADPGATIVAGVDDRNASTTPNYSHDVTAGDTRSELPPVTSFVIQPPTDDEFEDLTIHTPTAAIDQAVAAAPSPRPTENPLYESRGQIDAGATVVADLDLHLADPTPVDSPTVPSPLDLGPSDVSPDELDFAFDVSEQATSSDLNDTLSESFSSLMDISESQILGDSSTPTEGPLDATDSDSESVVTGFDDAFAAGYDVSASDLATAPRTPPTPYTPQRPTTPDSSSAVEQPMTIQGAGSPNGVLSLKPSEPDLDVELPRQTHGDGGRIPDLSPMIEQRIQETLEKVAWEAFADLSESIVKQVIGRIEKIAWEVIPEMAETLVREEIRKMKGEND